MQIAGVKNSRHKMVPYIRPLCISPPKNACDSEVLELYLEFYGIFKEINYNTQNSYFKLFDISCR